MILHSAQYSKDSIDLFKQNQSHDLVVHGQRRKRQFHMSFFENGRGKTMRTADDEGYFSDALVFELAEIGSESFGIKGFTLIVKGNNKFTCSNMRSNGFRFIFKDFPNVFVYSLVFQINEFQLTKRRYLL